MSSKAKQIGPQLEYERLIDNGELQPDTGQAEVVARLQDLHSRLLQAPKAPVTTTTKKGFFTSLFGGTASEESIDPISGLYLWGGVGRGKTLLCDMFFATLPIKEKKRVHFHRFMQSIHQELAQIKKEESPLEIVSAQLASKYKVLVLDEMHVNDITDAMLMSGLLRGLFKRGVTLVTTSNIEPDNLYKDGLQRAQFMPAIDAIKAHTDSVFLGGDIDYRMRLLQNARVYRSSKEPDAIDKLTNQFQKLAAQSGFTKNSAIEINDRDIPTLMLADDAVWFDFSALCETSRSTDDYIEIARSFHTIFVTDVPVMNDMTNDATRRFINMIDEFYDRGVKIVIAAEASPDALYSGDRLEFEFERTTSRLMEMQSKEYLGSPHRS